MSKYDLITILGPTASGKTTLAAELAYLLKTEIISADSRQVYKGMDIGTGKDLKDYHLKGVNIPYHLVDIVPSGYKYNVFEFQRDFLKSYTDIHNRGLTPIMCGGTGMYLEAILRGYRLIPVPEDKDLRNRLADKTLVELKMILAQYKRLHNETDVDTVKRAIRAIEIEQYYQKSPVEDFEFPKIKSLIIGINIDRELRREKITKRLHERLKEGMIQEVQILLDQGVLADDLIYYGLEYKFVTLYLIGKLSYDEMVSQLEIAIHQFSKRQMTWFRGMEKRGNRIHWIDASLSIVEKTTQIQELLKE